MKTIKVSKLKNNLQKEILQWNKEDSIVTLEKLESTNGYSPWVKAGDFSRGHLDIFDYEDGEFCINVGGYHGIRTSLVKAIVDQTEETLMLKTMNSIYKLIKDNNKESRAA